MRRRDPIEVEMVAVDFSESDPPVEGSINYSACFYVFGCLLAEDVPAAAGLMRPTHFIAPEGTIVNARPPAAVAGGNVEDFAAHCRWYSLRPGSGEGYRRAPGWLARTDAGKIQHALR